MYKCTHLHKCVIHFFIGALRINKKKWTENSFWHSKYCDKKWRNKQMTQRIWRAHQLQTWKFTIFTRYWHSNNIFFRIEGGGGALVFHSFAWNSTTNIDICIWVSMWKSDEEQILTSIVWHRCEFMWTTGRAGRCVNRRFLCRFCTCIVNQVEFLVISSNRVRFCCIFVFVRSVEHWMNSHTWTWKWATYRVFVL